MPARRRRTSAKRTTARRAVRRGRRPASPGASRESTPQALLGYVHDVRPAAGRMGTTNAEPYVPPVTIPPFTETAPDASPLPRPASPIARRRK